MQYCVIQKAAISLVPPVITSSEIQFLLRVFSNKIATQRWHVGIDWPAMFRAKSNGVGHLLYFTFNRNKL